MSVEVVDTGGDDVTFLGGGLAVGFTIAGLSPLPLLQTVCVKYYREILKFLMVYTAYTAGKER